MDKNFWVSHTEGPLTSSTIAIEGICNDDLNFLISFLNRENAIEIMKELDRKAENVRVCNSIKEAGISQKREKIKAKDEKPYDVKIGAIDSLEL